MGAVSVFKKIIFVWGIISMAFVLFITSYLVVAVWTSPKHDPKKEYTVHESDEGPFRIVVKRKRAENRYDTTINISKEGSPVVSDYLLPTEQYGIDLLTIDEVQMVPAGVGEYRMILYSAFYECDEASSNYIWFFKLNNDGMALIHSVDISEMHKIGPEENVILGYKHVSLPYVKGLGHEHFTVPVEIRVGDNIVISPMFNRRSMELLKKTIEKRANQRIEVLIKTELSDKAVKTEECKKAAKEIKEIATRKVIPY